MSAKDHLAAAWRKIPVDAIAFIVIAVGIVLTHVPLIKRGMCFNDPSWFFHFGQRTLHGDMPYRDYVFQVGPLPVFIDAAFQEWFGERYIASLFAGLFVKVLRVYVVWLIARRLANFPAAIALTVFCSFDPLFSFVHHWSTPYAELCFTLSALFFWIAMRAEGRKALAYLGLGGFSAALVFWSRQSSAILIAVVLFASTTILLVRKDYFTRRRYAAVWIGFAVGMLTLIVTLAAMGALGPAFQQMFIDGPGKKGIRGIPAVLDALSGGALVDGRFTAKWRGFMFFIGMPLGLVILSAVAASREWKISSSTLGLLLLPGLMFVGLLTRDASLEYTTDLPRTFLSILMAIAVVSPDRLRRWFGLEPLIAIGFAGLPLASDWALEMSFPGRGWGDVWALVTAVILLTLASTHLSQRIKTAFCVCLAVIGLAHTGVYLRADLNPFAKPEASDGTLTENAFAPRMRGKRNPVLRGLRIPIWRERALSWLGDQIAPDTTCFVYANLPSLYDLLDCTNPTLIDTTIADYPSAGDADMAVAALRANPPDYILAHERMWMSPPISLDLEGKIERYDSWNPKASFALHMGLRSIIDHYESIGTVGEGIGPEYAKMAANHWDNIDAVRVYRRKR